MFKNLQKYKFLKVELYMSQFYRYRYIFKNYVIFKKKLNVVVAYINHFVINV